MVPHQDIAVMSQAVAVSVAGVRVGVGGPTGSVGLEGSAVTLDEFIEQVQERGGFHTREHAEQASLATLAVLGELPADDGELPR
jgi:hypothetical protein